MKTAPTRRVAALTSFAGCLAVALAACGSGSAARGAAAGGRIVDVKLTDAGCDPARLDLAAGAVTFRVANSGTDKVLEFEVTEGDRVLGEVGNVTAGLERSLSLNLVAGSYGMKCPGGTTASEGRLIVDRGGAAAAASDAALAAAAERYRRYVEEQARVLMVTTKTFADAVVAGDVAAAKRAYVPARIPYERIEPVAESFVDLDRAIDARAGDVPAAEWGGFHKLEQALWARSATKGMAPVARKLLADVTDLQRRIRTVALDAGQIANGANALLSEVSKSMLTGEEERYSRTDLVDVEANLDGSRAAFDAIRGALDEQAPNLATEIHGRFDAVEQSLARYRSASGYVPYNRLTDADTRKLSQAIDALAEPLSQVGAKLVAS